MMLDERDEREKDAQYDEWNSEFLEFVFNNAKVIDFILQWLSIIVDKETRYEEECADMEGVYPAFQSIIPRWREACTTMAGNNKQQSNDEPDIN
jgi:hypothetical protein